MFGLALFTAFVGFLLHVVGFVDLTYGGSQSDFFSAYGGLLMVSPLLTWIGTIPASPLILLSDGPDLADLAVQC